MEVLLTNVTNPGEINHIKIGDVLKLTLRTRPLQKILVSNGQISSELGQTDKTGKLEKEITITEKEIGSWRQDFTTADNSDTGSVCFLVLGPNGETGKESPKEESIIP